MCTGVTCVQTAGGHEFTRMALETLFFSCFSKPLYHSDLAFGAAFSNSFGGILMERFGYPTSFLSLGFVAGLAFLLLRLAIPETASNNTAEIEPEYA